jgi:ankyrin repeat protein
LPCNRRRVLIASAVLAIPVAVVASLVLWAWWPDASRLTGAAARGDLAGVRLCLRLGVDPNTPSRWGWNRENEGQTPLTAAAQFGRVQVVRLLLEAGADPNRRDFGTEFPHQTPLSTAALHGQLEVCRVLLEAGADPNLPTNPMQPGDPGSWTALDWAIEAGQAAIADLLRRHGAVEGRRRGGRG